MKKYILTIVVGLFVPLGLVYGEKVDEFAHINKLIDTVVKGGKADSIKPTGIADLYEVILGADVFYVSKDGRYMLQGDLIDWQERVNQTEEARSGIRRDIVTQLDENELIIFAPENPQHTVTVFTDIDCGYCRKLHAEMDSYAQAGIAIRYAAFPRSGVNTPSYFKAVAAWCAKDPQAALTAAKAGQHIEKEIDDCQDPVAEQLKLARTLGLRGTPSLILEDGRLLPGYVPADRLLDVLNEGEK